MKYDLNQYHPMWRRAPRVGVFFGIKNLDTNMDSGRCSSLLMTLLKTLSTNIQIASGEDRCVEVRTAVTR